jgi:alkaline phosphatase
MAYDVDRAADWGGEPSLAEMTQAAIRMLSRDPKGYFLMVEGGLIDPALHGQDVNRAVTEGLAFEAAVAAAAAMTDPAETLIVVTSDHDHRLPPLNRGPRGAPVAGLDGWDPATNPPPAERVIPRGIGPLRIEIGDPEPPPPSAPAGQPAPLPVGGHGAADVPIFARGPMGWLFSGTVEQNYIFHVLRHALGLDAEG